ncbi:LysR family transcriptional regulator [Acidisoma cellulosilytica]|uniref:LysR family transcriptional regulator n=1 Tax=Acidisoma cellulosilyticum TaxID=2802395 RepID=A0A964E3C6_9PROT|nr:LysR family transcriptional regulator [Acidisoma cellulosilyticum]MCB8879708.1 LysR family transcriptional regulator [Acidisoma cellulosilyticum]
MTGVKFAEHMAVFMETARAGSFSAAARRAGLTPSAVMRQIDALEADLGLPLFIRSTRALALTDAGERLFARGQPLLDALADTHAEVSGLDGAVSGVLRIACFPTFGKRYVIPVLERLMRDYPALTVELDLTERLADPVVDRLDAVIRMGDLPNSTLIATRLAPERRLLVASPDYFRQFGPPDATKGFAGQRLLDKIHGADLLRWTYVLGHPAAEERDAKLAFRSDDFEALRAAALAGMGIAFLPSWVVGPDVRSGALVRLAWKNETWNAQPGAIHLLRALPQPPGKLRLFVEALRAVIGKPACWEV